VGRRFTSPSYFVPGFGPPRDVIARLLTATAVGEESYHTVASYRPFGRWNDPFFVLFLTLLFVLADAIPTLLLERYLARRPSQSSDVSFPPLRNELSSTCTFSSQPRRCNGLGRFLKRIPPRLNPLSPTQPHAPRVLSGPLSYGKQYTSKSSGMCRNIHSASEIKPG
jgi:hypothetical protein